MDITDKIISRADLFDNGLIVKFQDGTDVVVLVTTPNIYLDTIESLFVKQEPIKDLFLAETTDGTSNWLQLIYGSNGEYISEFEAYDIDTNDQVFMKANIYHRNQRDKKINGKFLTTDFKTNTIKLVDSIL